MAIIHLVSGSRWWGSMFKEAAVGVQMGDKSGSDGDLRVSGSAAVQQLGDLGDRRKFLPLPCPPKKRKKKYSTFFCS